MADKARLSLGAKTELAEAAAWYEECRPGLGLEFLTAVQGAIRVAEESPAIGRVVSRIKSRTVRRHLVPKFPYAIIYVPMESEVFVVAVAHHSRKPRFWRGRLRDR